jgi:hypothetical protein
MPGTPPMRTCPWSPATSESYDNPWRGHSPPPPTTKGKIIMLLSNLAIATLIVAAILTPPLLIALARSNRRERQQARIAPDTALERMMTQGGGVYMSHVPDVRAIATILHQDHQRMLTMEERIAGSQPWSSTWHTGPGHCDHHARTGHQPYHPSVTQGQQDSMTTTIATLAATAALAAAMLGASPAHASGAQAVVTAHHKDDMLETARLFHMSGTP